MCCARLGGPGFKGMTLKNPHLSSLPLVTLAIPKPKRSISAMEEVELGGGITPAHGAQYSEEHVGSLGSIIIQAQLTRTLH